MLYNNNKNQEAYAFGVLCELLSILILTLKGYVFITRRFKTKLGEIDLIFQKRNTIVFVEVKGRRTEEFDYSSIVSQNQWKRIMNASGLFLKQSKYSNLQKRFDMIIFDKRSFFPKHIKNISICF